MTDTASHLLETIRALPVDERRVLVDRVVREFGEDRPRHAPGALLGLFAHDPALLGRVCEEAMTARELHPLRVVGG